MKKFSFSLDTVLSYKDQVLDNLKGEHALIIEKVVHQEMHIKELEDQYESAAGRFGLETSNGIAIGTIREYENYLNFMQKKIIDAQKVLQQLKRKEEQKRAEVVEARKEKASIDKLKEKKLIQYDKDAQRYEERFIEEFVSNTRAARKSG